MPTPTRAAGMRYARAAPRPPVGFEGPAADATARDATARDATAPDAAGRAPSGRPRRRRPAALVVAGLLAGAAGAGVGLVASSGGPGTSVERTPAAKAVARAFVQASVLAENLGSPAPAGLPAGSAAWALQPVPLVRTAAGHLRLARAEHPWGSSGGVSPLTPAVAHRLLVAQGAEVRALFSGPARREQLGELASLVAGERRSHPVPISPGGARVTTWYTLQVHGDRARAEAVVEQWEQHDTVVGPAGSARVVATVTTDAVDANATLVRRKGRWRVVSWSRSPWQQPT